MMKTSLLFHGVLMDDIWHLAHMRVLHSQFGMFLEVWVLQFGEDWEAYQFSSGHLLEITSLLQNCILLKMSHHFFRKFPEQVMSMSSIFILLCSDGTFYLWETDTWTSAPWSSSSGFATGASWDPDGRMILVAFSESSTLGSIHFAAKPPSLDAHLLPVDLPEVTSLPVSQRIEKIAWDGSGERLAVSFKDGDGPYRGLIAIYDVRRTPLVSASLIVGVLASAAHILFFFVLMLFLSPGMLGIPSMSNLFNKVPVQTVFGSTNVLLLDPLL
ncbi:Aladin-like protein [Drosera capensis]